MMTCLGLGSIFVNGHGIYGYDYGPIRAGCSAEGSETQGLIFLQLYLSGYKILRYFPKAFGNP
jgi:hypothetical protein